MRIIDAVRSVMAQLPDPVREKMEGVQILIRPHPGVEHLEHGISEADAGCYIETGEDPFFDGDDEAERTIFLFTENIHPLTAAQVTRVLIHEIGHACGMEEDELRSLGLGFGVAA